MSDFKIASLWQLEGEELVLKPELEGCQDPELEEQMLDFLEGGGVVLSSPGLREDRLTGANNRVPLGYMSDGAWIWPMELSYYLKQHHLLPQSDFVAHMRQCDYKAPMPDKATLTAAFKLLSGSDNEGQ